MYCLLLLTLSVPSDTEPESRMSLFPIVDPSKKRRTTDTRQYHHGRYDEEDEIEEEKWRALFRPTEEKVVFVSSDKKYFSVNKAMLSGER